MGSGRPGRAVGRPAHPRRDPCRPARDPAGGDRGRPRIARLPDLGPGPAMTTAPPAAGVLDELVDAATALGVMRADGSIDPSWFEHPLNHIGRVFGDDGQREALLHLLDGLL